MSETKKNWITVTESKYPWERDALEFVRDRWPDHEPYRAWANFEFIALDGSINEVDLLLLTPMGLFLVETKSRPGRVHGDLGTWTWDTEGRLVTAANPLLAANFKAKKLRQLLERQKTVKVKSSLPWVEALVFLSAPNVQCELRDTAAYRVCLRDRAASSGQPERPGLLAAVRRRECPGLDAAPGRPWIAPSPRRSARRWSRPASTPRSGTAASATTCWNGSSRKGRATRTGRPATPRATRRGPV